MNCIKESWHWVKYKECLVMLYLQIVGTDLYHSTSNNFEQFIAIYDEILNHSQPVEYIILNSYV